jgi:hypothetical protein
MQERSSFSETLLVGLHIAPLISESAVQVPINATDRRVGRSQPPAPNSLARLVK